MASEGVEGVILSTYSRYLDGKHSVLEYCMSYYLIEYIICL